MSDDLYVLLGVTRDADARALKRAWRDLARKLHPDRNRDDPAAGEKLAAVNAAYDVLSDPERRAQYDRYGADAASVFFDPSTAEPLPSAPQGKPVQRGIRTGPVRAKPVRHGADANVVLLLSATAASRGGVQRVDVDPDRTCPSCNGTGLRRSGRLCSKCEHGVIRGLGSFRVQVPRGVRSGQVLLASGHGHPGTGRGAQRGDLRITVDIEPVYGADGLDRTLELAAEASVLRQGGILEVPPPVGEPVRIRIRPETRPGQKIRLRGKAEAGRDLVVELVSIPDEPVPVDVVRV